MVPTPASSIPKKDFAQTSMPDAINHPPHYTSHPSGVECIDVAEWMSYNIGNVFKYCWRSGLKTENPLEDLRKAAWYLDREIERLQASGRSDRR